MSPLLPRLSLYSVTHLAPPKAHNRRSVCEGGQEFRAGWGSIPPSLHKRPAPDEFAPLVTHTGDLCTSPSPRLACWPQGRPMTTEAGPEERGTAAGQMGRLERRQMWSQYFQCTVRKNMSG
uniref:Uncharacterized protein n=1 Tax=Knipowitschia caucasica TaxID=637954 RepID=A0AAV2L3H1_KNICA